MPKPVQIGNRWFWSFEDREMSFPDDPFWVPPTDWGSSSGDMTAATYDPAGDAGQLMAESVYDTSGNRSEVMFQNVYDASGYVTQMAPLTTGVKNIVEDYGADPTGTADATTIFNTAFADNDLNHLIIPPGGYRIDGNLSCLRRNALTVSGVGSPGFSGLEVGTTQDPSELWFYGTSSGHRLTIDGARVHFKDLVLRNRGDAMGGYAVVRTSDDADAVPSTRMIILERCLIGGGTGDADPPEASGDGIGLFMDNITGAGQNEQHQVINCSITGFSKAVQVNETNSKGHFFRGCDIRNCYLGYDIPTGGPMTIIGGIIVGTGAGTNIGFDIGVFPHPVQVIGVTMETLEQFCVTAGSTKGNVLFQACQIKGDAAESGTSFLFYRMYGGCLTLDGCEFGDYEATPKTEFEVTHPATTTDSVGDLIVRGCIFAHSDPFSVSNDWGTPPDPDEKIRCHWYGNSYRFSAANYSIPLLAPAYNWLHEGSVPFYPVAQAGESRTVVRGDINTLIECDSTNLTTVTIPPDATLNAVTGAVFRVMRTSSVQDTVVAGGPGVTIQDTTSTAAQYDILELTKRAADTWLSKKL